MRNWLMGFSMCQSMFCAIPSPCHGWDEDCRDRMLLCLPLLGLELGAVWYGAACLCFLLNLPSLIRGLVIGCTLYLLTGFIHLDGFMDVVDAVRSYRPLQQRREILKDSHVGSFAVIAVAMLIAASVCVGASLEKPSLVLVLIPAVSRACSCIAVMSLKPMQTSQYAGLSKTASARVVTHIGLWLMVFAGLALCRMAGFALIGVILGYCLFLRRGYKSLEGMNGDISGYAQTMAELVGLTALVFL